MVQCSTVWCSVVYCGSLWCSGVKCGSLLCARCNAVWYILVKCGVVYFTAVQCGSLWWYCVRAAKLASESDGEDTSAPSRQQSDFFKLFAQLKFRYFWELSKHYELIKDKVRVTGKTHLHQVANKVISSNFLLS